MTRDELIKHLQQFDSNFEVYLGGSDGPVDQTKLNQGKVILTKTCDVMPTADKSPCILIEIE